jgi:hypothetical protein
MCVCVCVCVCVLGWAVGCDVNVAEITLNNLIRNPYVLSQFPLGPLYSSVGVCMCVNI